MSFRLQIAQCLLNAEAQTVFRGMKIRALFPDSNWFSWVCAHFRKKEPVWCDLFLLCGKTKEWQDSPPQGRRCLIWGKYHCVCSEPYFARTYAVSLQVYKSFPCFPLHVKFPSSWRVQLTIKLQSVTEDVWQRRARRRIAGDPSLFDFLSCHPASGIN